MLLLDAIFFAVGPAAQGGARRRGFPAAQRSGGARRGEKKMSGDPEHREYRFFETDIDIGTKKFRSMRKALKVFEKIDKAHGYCQCPACLPKGREQRLKRHLKSALNDALDYDKDFFALKLGDFLIHAEAAKGLSPDQLKFAAERIARELFAHRSNLRGFPVNLQRFMQYLFWERGQRFIMHLDMEEEIAREHGIPTHDCFISRCMIEADRKPTWFEERYVEVQLLELMGSGGLNKFFTGLPAAVGPAAVDPPAGPAAVDGGADEEIAAMLGGVDFTRGE